MQVFEMPIYIYADNQQEVDECRKAVISFIDENRAEGRAATPSEAAVAKTNK